ncbi:MAG: RagB/SusD family nutrient uptake outer membrane protein [Alistipes sp.]|nr:RagB/SusD family nutrient uptake outer membrane protein [Alistipes sp.]
MKIKYFILSAVTSVLALGACSDALDMAPSGNIDMEDVWKDHDKVGAYLNTCYARIENRCIVDWYFTTNIPVGASDDAWDADAEVETGLGAAQSYNGVGTSGSHPWRGNVDWGSLWEGIRRCNMMIARLPGATVNSETDRARWMSEAHLLRAYYYAELFYFYGEMVPIITKVTDHYDDFHQYAVKSSFRQIGDFIMADCDTALMEEQLPWRATSGSESSRVTKGLAWAIKSRVATLLASPLCATNQTDAMTWEEAYQVNREALEELRANNYELFQMTGTNSHDVFGTRGQVKWAKGATGAANYHYYFCNTRDYNSNPRDKESIWERGSYGAIWNVCGIGFQGYYKCGLCPSQELVDQYENVVYNSNEAIASYPVVDLQDPYLDHTHLQPNYNPENPVYNPNKPYVDRDPRFYATVTYNECIRTAFWKNEEIDGRSGVRYAGNAIRTKTIWTNKEDEYTGIHASRRQRTRTGYYMNKYLSLESGENAGDEGAGGKIYRFAEIILNTAECAANANHVEEAMSLVNEVRDRVGMPALPLSPSQDEAKLYVKHERRVEFAAEELRLLDMRRWQRPDGDMSQYEWVTAMEISWLGDDKEGKPIYTYTRKAIRQTPRRCYTNKWLWVPIPLSDQNRLETLSGHTWQNPGW